MYRDQPEGQPASQAAFTDDEEDGELAHRPAPLPDPINHRPVPSGIGMSGPATAWARSNPQVASRLLEWAAQCHEPKELKLRMEKVSFAVPYVKMEEMGECLVFYLAPGAPAIGLDFGCELELTFGERKVNASAALSGLGTDGQFPYARLEFLFEGQ